jgi:exopolysaccharide production protein ExoY
MPLFDVNLAQMETFRLCERSVKSFADDLASRATARILIPTEVTGLSIELCTKPISRTFVPARLTTLESAERAAGLVLLAVAAPVIAVSGLIVAILARRSPLVAHLRVGQDQTLFWMLKLRSMWATEPVRDRERGWIERVVAEPEGDHKIPDDSRVTSRFAVFCRRHSIDELPQLWHVFRGEMSLVGPRPLTRGEIVRYIGVHAAELLSRKPGLTGLWQVSGRSTVPFPERAALDLRLVRTLTPSVYLKILLRTIPALISGSGAW